MNITQMAIEMKLMASAVSASCDRGKWPEWEDRIKLAGAVNARS
jgi:hypothetical protein